VSAIRITGGAIHDPANDVDGEVRDLCLQDGKVVADVGPEARRIDARGMVVMPGGVDIHAHIAGPAVNAARRRQACPPVCRASMERWRNHEARWGESRELLPPATEFVAENAVG